MFKKSVSIKKHITWVVLTAVLVPLLICSVTTLIMSYNSSISSAQTNMEETAKLTAERINWELKSYSNIAKAAGCNAKIASPDTPLEEKQQYLDTIVASNNMKRANILGTDGISIFDGVDFSDKPCFLEAMKGNATTSEPTVSPVTGEITVITAAPVWQDGKEGTTPIGCVYFVPAEGEFLNNIMREIHFSKNSAAYMIDKNGNTIADTDSDIVKNGQNIEALAKEDTTGKGGYATLAKAHEKMRNGETGFTSYTLNGTKKFIGYAPVEGTDGWSVAVYAPTKDLLGNMNLTIIITVALIALTVGESILSSVGVAKRIGNPVKQCSDRLGQLAKGDLSSPIPEVTCKDETGALANSTGELVNHFNRIIGDMNVVLSGMSEGNFDIQSENPNEIYVGDFKKLNELVNEINVKLSSTLRQINHAADQVSSGANQVSSGAQVLAQGATEQASSIEQLAASVTSISDMMSKNVEDAENASELSGKAGNRLSEANRKMDELVLAMQEIKDSSNETKNIIKTIEDIAFQTNILALNAAIEAARAGEAGKGFAVVADEVRNLAVKSAEAAQNTNVLIEGTATAIDNVNELVGNVADVMDKVSEATGQVMEINTKIASSSKSAADSVAQVNIGVEQISNVVQTNSATAEQSAAASEELSGQAQLLDQLISEFKLREE